MNNMRHSTALAQQQCDLLSALFTTNKIATQAINTPARYMFNIVKRNSLRGLQTYQANATASALRSMQTAYPVIAQLIGDDAFEHLARDFWAQHPPTHGDLAQWGKELPVFIASISQLEAEPYLSDVATVEWALHTAATAADQTMHLASFSLLSEQDPDAITLQFAPGTALIQSNYPIASLLTAHLYNTPSFEEVGQKLRQNTAEIALVWRQGLRPMVSSCTVGEAAFISSLLVGNSLLASLETHAIDTLASIDFNTWLPQAVQSGLLIGARLL
jgi:Putative DNA-binding domain